MRSPGPAQPFLPHCRPLRECWEKPVAQSAGSGDSMVSKVYVSPSSWSMYFGEGAGHQTKRLHTSKEVTNVNTCWALKTKYMVLRERTQGMRVYRHTENIHRECRQGQPGGREGSLEEVRCKVTFSLETS